MAKKSTKSSQTQTAKLNRHTLSMALDQVQHAYGLFDLQHSDRLLAETGKSRQQILDAVMADDEVLSCREDVFAALLSKNWRIWGKDVDENIINALYRWLRPLLEDFAALSILARFNGYAVAEYVYDMDWNSEGFLPIKQILSKDGELDDYRPQRDGRLVYRNEQELNQQLKFLLLRSKAVPARPCGEMMIIRVYPAVLLRKRGWAYAGQFIARYAQPYVIGKQSGYADTQQFTRTLYGFLDGGAAGINQDDDIHIHQLNGNGEAFERLEQLSNARIQKSILGRVKTSELAIGSRSAQETDDKVRENRMRGYLDLMAKAIQHAINAMLDVAAQFGTPIYAPQGIWFEYEEQTKVDKTRAERDKLYCDTGQVELTEDYMVDVVGYEKHHIKMVKPSQTSMPLSLKLSQSHDEHHHNHDEDDEYQPDDKIIQAKLQAIFADLERSQSYAEFEQKLAKLNLPDAGLTDDLALQMTKQFVKGLAGVEHG